MPFKIGVRSVIPTNKTTQKVCLIITAVLVVIIVLGLIVLLCLIYGVSSGSSASGSGSSANGGGAGGGSSSQANANDPYANVETRTDAPVTDYQKRALVLHNVLRLKHKVGTMRMEDDKNEIAIKCAQYYVDRGILDHTCPYKFIPNYRLPLGENLFRADLSQADPTYPGHKWAFDDTIIAENATMGFYREIEHYTFGEAQPYNLMQVGHFTQVVWKESYDLGFGIVRDSTQVVAVAIYNPPGNFHGQFANNVFPA